MRFLSQRSGGCRLNRDGASTRQHPRMPAPVEFWHPRAWRVKHSQGARAEGRKRLPRPSQHAQHDRSRPGRHGTDTPHDHIHEMATPIHLTKGVASLRVLTRQRPCNCSIGRWPLPRHFEIPQKLTRSRGLPGLGSRLVRTPWWEVRTAYSPAAVVEGGVDGADFSAGGAQPIRVLTQKIARTQANRAFRITISLLSYE
jgi:hypothetical protein